METRKSVADLSPSDRVAFEFLFGMIASIAIGVALIYAAQSDAPHAIRLLLAIAIALVCTNVLLLLTVAWHELGHFVVGKAAGLKLDFFQLGPLIWYREQGRFRHTRVGKFTQCSGFVAMSPQEGKITIEQRRKMIAGGPVFSILLLFALLALIVKLRALQHLMSGTDAQVFTTPLLLLATYISLAFLARNAVPRRIRGFENDALVLLQSYRDPEAVRIWFRMMDIRPKVQAGFRYRDLDYVVIRELLSMEGLKGHNRLVVELYAYSCSFDRGDLKEALRHIENAFEILTVQDTLSAAVRAGVANQLAFARAFVGRDVEGARAALEISQGIPQSHKSSLLFAKASIAFAEGSSDAAIELIDRGFEARKAERVAPTPVNLAFNEFWGCLRNDIVAGRPSESGSG